MQNRMNDTSEEAERVQLEIYRRMTPAQKWAAIASLYELGKMLQMAGLRMEHPEASEKEIWHMWARRHLGDELYEKVYGNQTGGSKTGR
jgi:hypothetical protein